METRICRKCHQKLSLKNFELQKNKWRRYICKQCKTKDRLKWRKNNREKDRISVRKYQDRIRFGCSRKTILEKNNCECKNCGKKFKITLCVHHKDGKGRSYIKSNNQLNNLVIMCKSCHHSLHAKQTRRDRYGKFAK